MKKIIRYSLSIGAPLLFMFSSLTQAQEFNNIEGIYIQRTDSNRTVAKISQSQGQYSIKFYGSDGDFCTVVLVRDSETNNLKGACNIGSGYNSALYEGELIIGKDGTPELRWRIGEADASSSWFNASLSQN